MANKRITLSFKPATQADRRLIESYLPTVPEGQALDPTTLPTSLPGYLLKLKAELKIDGEVVKSGGHFSLGQELSTASAITTAPGMWLPAYDKPIAGEFYAIGIDSQGISAKQLEKLATQMETVDAKLGTQAPDGITKDEFIGGMLHAGVLTYFAANDVNLKMLNHGGKVLSYRLPSFGTFSTSLKPTYFFGIPQRVQMEGIRVNVDFLNKSLWAVDNDRATTVAITQQIGLMASALEQRIPELLFTDPDDGQPASGVSAVHALMIAAQEGQQIYQVTSENVDVVLPLLNVKTDVKDDIRTGVAAGKIATISQNQVTVGDWVGVGYIITDPRTGTGAYLISGGYNGAFLRLVAHFSGAINVFSLMSMLPKVGLEALAPPWDNIFEHLKCSGVDQLIKEAIMAILTAVMMVLILAAATRFKRPEAIAPLIRLAMSLLTVLSNRVAMAVGPKKSKCGSPNLKLISIHFSAHDPQKFLQIKKDKQNGITPIPIDQPQWKKGQSQPLAYVADGYKTFMKMTAKFQVKRAPKKPIVVKIKTQVSIGNANQNVKAEVPTFPEKSLTLKYGDLEKTSEFQQSNFLTLNLTQFFNSMKINWKFSYKNNRIKTIGASKHKVYITRDKPVDEDSIFLTLLHLATSNPGAFSQAEVVEKTWELFKRPKDGMPSVKAWNGDPLIYYPEERGFNDFIIRDAEDFLKLRVGPCAPFAALFANSLRINNLTVGYVTVEAKDNSRFMIDNWDFKEQSFPKEDRFQFYLTNESGEPGMVPPPSSYGDLVNKPGLPGQNISTPSEKVFKKHYIVDLSSVPGLKGHRYYDPSYGITFKDADHFEREVVFGYAYKDGDTSLREIPYKVQQVIPTLYPRNIEFNSF